jgi:two-component system, LytTR family, response regulator
MNAPIRAVIADDEPLARRMLRSLLSKDTQINVVGEARDGEEAEEVVRRLSPDLLLLDVQMPNVDGFSALKNLPERPVVVFITAHADHAVRAFDLDAADYLLKPFDDERFERAMTRAKAEVRTRNLMKLVQSIASDTPAPAAAQPVQEERLALNEGRRVVMVEIRDIDWIEAADYYAQVHVRGAKHLIRQSLQELEARLGARQFLRIHRGALVNIGHIQRLERLDDGELLVVLHDGTKLGVSRSRRQHIAQVLGAR